MSQTPRFPAQVLRQQTEIILTGWGMPAETAAQTAELIVETDLLGIDSHGISMLPHYQRLLAEGKWQPAGQAKIVSETPVTAVVDGGNSLGHATSLLAVKTAVEKAKKLGLAAVTVRNSNHFGAAGLYARYAAAEGLIALVTSTTRGSIQVPSGGKSPVLGTNPIAFSAPASKNDDFVLDMATTTVAANKVKVYDFYDKAVPAGWVVDENGRPVTETKSAMEYVFQRKEGGLTPLGGSTETGGHKGYGLAMLAQILSGPLAGAGFGARQDKNELPNVGHFFLVIDPKAFRSEEQFEQDLDQIIDTLHATPATDSNQPVLVAGEPENQTHRQRSVEGIPVPLVLLAQLSDLCEQGQFTNVLGDKRQWV